jgi:hypothetical protein
MHFDQFADRPIKQVDSGANRMRARTLTSTGRTAPTTDQPNPARDHLLDAFCCLRVIYCVQDAISQFPARRLTPGECALAAEWLAAAGDVTSAYVSSRRGDDPALHHRIIIATGPGDGPSHFVHAPSGRDIWVVFSAGPRTRVRRFQTLRAALNSIRPVLGKMGSEHVPAKAKQASRTSRMPSRKPGARANKPKVD